MKGTKWFIVFSALMLGNRTDSLRADTLITMAHIRDAGDFAEAKAYMQSWVKPEDYDTASYVDAKIWGAERLGTSLDLYLREWVLLGKADIDGDGVAERFYALIDPASCGSIGCTIRIVQKRAGVDHELCNMGGPDEDIWLTDRVSPNGYRELKIGTRVRWHGDACEPDDPETPPGSPDHDHPH